MAKRKVTLYIEDTEIKLLVSRGRKIEKWASYMLEPSLVRDGAIIDEINVAQAIKELFELQQVKEKKITVALSGLNSIFRVINLPQLPSKMVPEAIVNEASRAIPMPLDEVYLSHQIISSKGGEIQVFLVAYPRNLTDVLMRTLTKAGLKATAMDLAPLALARTVNDSKAIVVNSWLTNLDIVILVDQLPQVVRSISLSGEDMTPEEKSSSILEEFNRTVSFYNSSRKDNPLDTSVPVYVCGDLSQDEALWQSLNMNMLDYKINTISAPIEAPEAFIPCRYMVNIGLALKGNLPGGDENNFSVVEFNALPEAYMPPSFSWYRILVPVAAVTAIGGLFYFWLIIQDVGNDINLIKEQTVALNAQADQIRAEITPVRDAINQQKDLIQPLPGEIDNLETQIEQTQNLIVIFDQTADDFTQGLIDINADLPELLDLKPEQVTLSAISYQGGSINITGTSLTENSLYEYAKVLRLSERFETVTVTAISGAREMVVDEEEVVLYSFTLVIQ